MELVRPSVEIWEQYPPHSNTALVAKPLKEEFIKRNYI